MIKRKTIEPSGPKDQERDIDEQKPREGRPKIGKPPECGRIDKRRQIGKGRQQDDYCANRLEYVFEKTPEQLFEVIFCKVSIFAGNIMTFIRGVLLHNA